MRKCKAFTLAELLIALAILGVIAVFTIPKVLQSQTDSRYKSIAKEAAGTLTAAYQTFKMNNPITSGTRGFDLTPFMNYVAVDTVSLIDDTPTFGSVSCAPGCYRLHNGAVIRPFNCGMGGTGSTNAIAFVVDPDGTYSGTTNGAGKSVDFYIYYDGRLRTEGTQEPNTTMNSCPVSNPNPALDPSWFSWN